MSASSKIIQSNNFVALYKLTEDVIKKMIEKPKGVWPSGIWVLLFERDVSLIFFDCATSFKMKKGT